MRRLDKLVNGGLDLSSRQFKLMIDLAKKFGQKSKNLVTFINVWSMSICKKHLKLFVGLGIEKI